MSETPPREPAEPNGEDEPISDPGDGGPDGPAGDRGPEDGEPTDAGWLLAGLAAIVVALILLLAATWAGLLPIGAAGPGVQEPPTAVSETPTGESTPRATGTPVPNTTGEPIVIELTVNVTESQNASRPDVVVVNIESPNETRQDVIVVDVDSVAAAEAGSEVRVVSEQENVQIVRDPEDDRDGDWDGDRDDRDRDGDRDGDREDDHGGDRDGDRDENSIDSGRLTVVEVHYDAAGNDPQNLNDEYIVFENTGEAPLDMGGWTISDEVERRKPYTVPPGFALASGGTVTLYSGSGTNTDTELYWGSGRVIWNNVRGDTITVRDGTNVVLEYSYEGGREGDDGDRDEDRDQVDSRVVTQCTRIDEPGRYELTRDVRNSDADTCLEITADDVELRGNGHVVDGVDGDGTAGVRISPSGREDTAEGVTITNLEVSDWGIGVRVSEWTNGGQVTDLLVRDVTSTSNVRDGVYAAHTENGRIDGVTARNNGRHGVFLQEIDDRNRVTNSEVVGNDGTGILAFEAGTGLVIEDSTVRDNDQRGISTSNGDEDVSIEDNLVELNGAAGLDLDESAAITVAGNTIRSNGGDGVLAQDLGRDAAIRQNEIRRNAGDGVALESTRQASVARNTIRDNHEYGVSLETVRETTVRNNDLCDNDEGPFQDVDGTDNQFVDNACGAEDDVAPASTPTESPMPTETSTPSDPTATPTATATATGTTPTEPTDTATETAPPTRPASPTSTPTRTATPTESPQPAPPGTSTPAKTATPTPSPSALGAFLSWLQAAMAVPSGSLGPLVGGVPGL